MLHGALIFDSMISFVVQDASEMLILSYNCNVTNLLLANDGHGARSLWGPKHLLLALANTTTSEREKELGFAFLQIGSEAIPFHGVQEQ